MSFTTTSLGMKNKKSTIYQIFHMLDDSRYALDFRSFERVCLFASTRTTHYNEFVKGLCFKVYLNPWSKEECEKFAEVINFKDEKEWRRRFDLVGGKPRLLFPSSIQFKELVIGVNSGIPATLNKLKEKVQLFEQNVFDDEMKHVVFSIYRDKD